MNIELTDDEMKVFQGFCSHNQLTETQMFRLMLKYYQAKTSEKWHSFAQLHKLEENHHYED